MSAINDGGPAFPCTPPDGNPNAYAMFPSGPGMTLRDWFAGQALAGLLANGGAQFWEGDAQNAYAAADAMLAAREGGSND